MEEEKVDRTSRVGTTVRYYLNGWRCGQLESIDGPLVAIKPVSHKAKVRSVHIPLEDVDFEEVSLK